MMATSRTTSIKKMNLYFTYESRDCLKSSTLFITIKTIAKLNSEFSAKLAVEVTTRFPNNAKFDHLTSFCRGRQRNVPRIITQVHTIVLLINSFV